MATILTRSPLTIAELVERLGGVPLDRIRCRPALGTATVQDVIDIHAREKRLCELIDGVLVEKVMGLPESRIGVWVGTIINNYVTSHDLGVVTGADGTMQLYPDRVRIPDVAFTSWERIPDEEFPSMAVPLLSPDLAVEVLSEGNTQREMALRRQDYFASGTRLVWQIDPRRNTVTVYRSLTDFQVFREHDQLDGGEVLPGFSIKVSELFPPQRRRTP